MVSVADTALNHHSLTIDYGIHIKWTHYDDYFLSMKIALVANRHPRSELSDTAGGGTVWTDTALRNTNQVLRKYVVMTTRKLSSNFCLDKRNGLGVKTS